MHPSQWRHLLDAVLDHPRREGSLIVCDGFALNITDRKQAEQRIMVEAGRFESLVNNIHNGSLFCCEIEASVLATIHTPEDLFEKSFAN